jgi:3-deoxy-D-manno-octulosonic-acid transferase
MLIIYSLLFYLVLPLLPLRLWWRGRKNAAYRERWSERFAWYRYTPLPMLEKSIWIHAVSLGEAVAATPLVKALQQRYPQIPIVFTSMTPTGSAHIQRTFGKEKAIIHCYLPYDYPSAINRFLNRFHPQILVVMETELWPNMLYQTARHRIPIILANARLTERSFKSYYKVHFFIKKMLSKINLINAQSGKDQAYFLQLGADEKRVVVSGNIKFDLTIDAAVIENAKNLRHELNRSFYNDDSAQLRPAWIAASTHEGEEELVLKAHKEILANKHDALLILAPRHPERFDKVVKLCKDRGFDVIRYSAINGGKPIPSLKFNILIDDVMGKLLLFYAMSDVAFVGGSLVPIGGHNVIEPAALGLPIIVGPHTETLADIKPQLENAEGLITISDYSSLASTILLLLENSSECSRRGTAAKNVVIKNQGALGKIVKAIDQHLKA